MTTKNDNRLFWLFLAAVFALAMLTASCAHKPMIERHETARTDSVTHYVDRFYTDTVWQWLHDSIRVAHYVDRSRDTVNVLDSVILLKIMTRTEYITDYVHDSIYVHDSLRIADSVPYEVVRKIEVRKRNGYDKFTARGFWVLLLIICAALAYGVRNAFK